MKDDRFMIDWSDVWVRIMTSPEVIKEVVNCKTNSDKNDAIEAHFNYFIMLQRYVEDSQL